MKRDSDFFLIMLVLCIVWSDVALSEFERGCAVLTTIVTIVYTVAALRKEGTRR